MKFSRVYIWGPNPFTNRLFASHIETITKVTPECVCIDNERNGHGFAERSIVFCDCDKLDPLSYCRKLYQPGNKFDLSPDIILMNVRREQELLDEIKIYSILGIFYSDDNFELIGKGIRKVLEGEHWLSRKILVRSLQSIREEWRQERSKAMPMLLTMREQEIVQMIAAGHDNQAIAEALFISPNTVKTHVSNIYKKIDVSNRVQAILWASENAGQFVTLASARANDSFRGINEVHMP